MTRKRSISFPAPLLARQCLEGLQTSRSIALQFQTPNEMGRLVYVHLSIIILLGHWVWSKANSEDYANCTGLASKTGNGVCESDNNNESCGWDGGDCCECTCVDDLDIPLSCSVFDCLDPSSECDDDSGTYDHTNCTGNLNATNNGLCNSENNNEACGWDGGDCCECTCATNQSRDYACPFFACLDPNSGCPDPRLQDYINCTGYVRVNTRQHFVAFRERKLDSLQR